MKEPIRVALDHIVVAVDDLDAAATLTEALIGVAPTGGGRHDGAGTENRIVPLGSSYLELVTVCSQTEAEQDPFGRLVLQAERDGCSLAAWCVAAATPPTDRPGHRLTRAGVDVRLFGLDAALREPSRPFILVRGDGQALPGGDESEWATSIIELHGPVVPGLPGAVPLPRGPVAVRRKTGGSSIRGLVLRHANGDTRYIDETTWRKP